VTIKKMLGVTRAIRMQWATWANGTEHFGRDGNPARMQLLRNGSKGGYSNKAAKKLLIRPKNFRCGGWTDSADRAAVCGSGGRERIGKSPASWIGGAGGSLARNTKGASTWTWTSLGLDGGSAAVSEAIANLAGAGSAANEAGLAGGSLADTLSDEGARLSEAGGMVAARITGIAGGGQPQSAGTAASTLLNRPE